MRDKTQHETYCLILRDTVHKIDARQSGKIAGHLWPRTSKPVKSDVAKMYYADTQHLVDYLQGWHWSNNDSMDILNDSGNKKLPVGPQDCKTRHTIVEYSC